MSTDQPVDHTPADAASTPGKSAPTRGTAGPGPTHDPLRGSRTSGTWIAVLVLALLLVLLAVFILQNTQKADVSFFGWTGRAPLSATLLIAAAGGALVVAGASMLRILQLRRRVKRERKV